MATIINKETVKKNINAKIEQINALCIHGTHAEVEKELVALKALEKQYLELHKQDVYASCKSIHDAITTLGFETLTHKKVNENGVMKCVELDKKVQLIDLKDFCESQGYPVNWYYEVEALNKRLTLKVAEEVGVATTQLDNSIVMSRYAAEIELGKTPTSNTKCVAHMQKVLDMLSEGEGKVCNKDLAFIMFSFAKLNNKMSLKEKKSALKLICGKPQALLSLLTRVFYRVATNGDFSVESKCVKTAEDLEDLATTAAAETTTAETTTTETTPTAPVKEGVEQ